MPERRKAILPARPDRKITACFQMKRIRFVLGGLILLMLLFPAVSRAEDETVSEGGDTECTITGYTPYAGASESVFLKRGDAVAVIAPSSLPTRKQTVATVSGLRRWGYQPVLGRHVYDQTRTLEDCIEDLTWALTDPSVKAVFCVRGGYGASEVMDAMPPDLIASSGKLIIGYSDITVFHSAWTAAGLPSLQATMSAAFTKLPVECAEAERRMMQGEIPSYRCKSSPLCRAGSAEGILIGGNLSTFAAVLGTAYDCSRMGVPYILFLEDVSEDLQHIHRLLTILKHQGVLDRAEGLIFGEWVDLPADWVTYGADSRGGEFQSVADLISREFLPDLNPDIPVAFGFPAGHGDTFYPLLMGEKARLCVTGGSYTLEWG